jgi:hypothetical protein
VLKWLKYEKGETMSYFGCFFLDQEKDIIVNLYQDAEGLSYLLETPNHKTGNLITNLAEMCHLPLSFNETGLKVIRGRVPCYVDAYGRDVYIFRLNNTKTANIYPDGRIEMKASLPAIAKTLMSQTKQYHLPFEQTLVKAYIRKECKFSTDLHTHMNANLSADVLIAMGIVHQIQYPLYYIRKLQLRCTPAQRALLSRRRKAAEKQWQDCGLSGKYLQRKIDDHTMINFASFMLDDPDNAAYNIPRIRASLAVNKDGQAVFTDLEKVYLYRYVFTKGTESEEKIQLHDIDAIPDEDIIRYVKKMLQDKADPAYQNNTIFQDNLLWIGRRYQRERISYVEISDTTLVKKDQALKMLREVHQVMPAVYQETGVRIRFLAALRRIPLTIVKDQISGSDLADNLQALYAVSVDPYVAGCDIVGEEINDIREMKPLIEQLVRIAAEDPSFTIRIHAGENDSLRDNVYNSIACVKEALSPGQKMPHVRIGHGLYTASLTSKKGRQLLDLISATGTVLEFQITSNVRLNNLSELRRHPLKQYLKAGIACVQGTDGAALYGTSSIDEQLALEKMLDLTFDEMKAMHEAEEKVRKEGEEAFARKEKVLQQLLSDTDPRSCYQQRLQAAEAFRMNLLVSDDKVDADEVLKDQYRPFPEHKVPLILAGGSFNNDSHKTRVSSEGKKLIDQLLQQADPGRVFFVIGHTLSGYEKYLFEQAEGKFEVFAIVPARLKKEQAARLRKAGLPVHFSIEGEAMGLYKSFTYEIYKKRPSVTLAFDGNSAAANLIQDGRNSAFRTYAFLNPRSHALRAKGHMIEGYVTMMKDGDTDEIMRRLRQAYAHMQ